MPIKIQDSLPAQKILENENIFVMTEYRAIHAAVEYPDALHDTPSLQIYFHFPEFSGQVVNPEF